jgi:hypothetical protein
MHEDDEGIMIMNDRDHRRRMDAVAAAYAGAPMKRDLRV